MYWTIIVECRHECSVILYSVTNAGMCSESVIVVHDVRTAFTIESRFSPQFEAVWITFQSSISPDWSTYERHSRSAFFRGLEKRTFSFQICRHHHYNLFIHFHSFSFISAVGVVVLVLALHLTSDISTIVFLKDRKKERKWKRERERQQHKSPRDREPNPKYSRVIVLLQLWGRSLLFLLLFISPSSFLLPFSLMGHMRYMAFLRRQYHPSRRHRRLQRRRQRRQHRIHQYYLIQLLQLHVKLQFL